MVVMDSAKSSGMLFVVVVVAVVSWVRSVLVVSEILSSMAVRVLGVTTVLEVSIHKPKTHSAMKIRVVRVDV